MKRSHEGEIPPLDVSATTSDATPKTNDMTDESPRSTTSEGGYRENYNNRGGGGYRGRGRGGGGYRSNQPKKPRQYKHAVEKLFDDYSNSLDDSNNRKERIYKATRDVTIEAKQIIFNLHRYDPKQGNKEEILKEAKEKIDSIVNEHLSIVKKEIDEKFSEYFWKYARSYSFGLQELIEAISFYYYIKDGSLVTCENIEKDTNFPVSRLDYLLGISDLTGELMRFATNHFTVETIPPSVKDFMSELFSHFQNLLVTCKGLSPYEEKDLKNKIEIMETSLSKVEKLCYNITLQKNDKYVNYKLI
ncbi:predicted protein [Naegleria gruberi]|uniref:Predicted protein n=1 Tax=Naegleria gruberi TaxID=5762 RepID=D2VXF3_NAEGR|nr:uncharacterized protein NAEGRDRAFT_81596 [Naegleria gruberi]EFC38428.1 predicted protein [Naegleria gruberi]|eukprot:XP_002671172.1 predicted protein [Naegleria gruberi strain NEG-M]